MTRKLLVFMFILTSAAWAGKYHPAIQYIFPLPGSALLPTKATIILRLHHEYLDSLKNINSLISVNGDTPYPGQTFFSTDEHTIIFKPSRDFQNGEKITVTIQTSQFDSWDFTYEFTVASHSPNTIPGLLKSESSRPEQAPNQKNSGEVRVINGVAVPSDFPTIETIVTGETAPGLIFYASNFRTEGFGNYLIMCKNDGTPYAYRRFDNVGNSANFVLHPTGVMSAYFFGPAHHVVLDNNLNIIDEYNPGHGYLGDDHELVILENGHALMIVEQHVAIDMSQVVEGGQQNANVQGNMFQEFDKDKNVILEWRTWDHYRLEDTIGRSLRDSNIDYVHMNSVYPDYDGHLIVSARHLNEITKIDRQTGEIIWRLGGVNNEFEFINDDIRFSHQHHCRPVPGQPNHYTMFDNGNTRSPNYSRAVEYELDLEKMTAEKVWEYRYEPDRQAYMMGSVQRLPNGNTFIDWSTTTPVKACEVTPDGEKVFDLYSHGASTYRSFRFEWNEMFDVPLLMLENYGYNINLIFNKFGDPNVAYYNIYQSTTPNNFVLLDTTSKTWYTAVELPNNKTHYFRISATYTDGSESDFSELVSTYVQYTLPGLNIVKNGEFENGSYWSLQRNDGASAIGSIRDETGYTVRITEPGGQLSDIQLQQENLMLMKGTEYTFEFDAYAETIRPIRMKIEKSTSPNTDYARLGAISLSPMKKHYSYTFKMENNSDTNARLAFHCGLYGSDVTFDNVVLKEGLEPSEVIYQTESLFDFRLYANYPNPFNASTLIKYSLPKDSFISLKVYNLQGQEVAVLVNEEQNAAEHVVKFHSDGLPSGIYFYQLKTGNYLVTQKMMLLK